MFKHKQTGAKGEQAAVKFLENKGYQILHTNWRSGKKEVDVIALVEDLLVFIEVKTRKNFAFGFPEEAVTKQKEHYLKAAVEDYLERNSELQKIRFDIISVVIEADEVKEIKHFEDAFF